MGKRCQLHEHMACLGNHNILLNLVAVQLAANLCCSFLAFAQDG